MACIDLERHLNMYPDVSSGGLFASSALRSGWCASYRACVKCQKQSVCVCCNLGEVFCVYVEVHQGSSLSPLLFITVLGALFHECRKGLRVNMGKTNVLTSGSELNMPQKSSKDPVVRVSRVLAQTPSSVEVVQEMQWYLWPFEAWSHHQAYMIYWTMSHGWISRSSCPTSPPAHFPLPPEKSLHFVHQERHAHCQRSLGPRLTWSTSPAIQSLGCGPPDVWCHHQGPSQLTRSREEDAARRSGEGTLHT